jgi:hypothetical protein
MIKIGIVGKIRSGEHEGWYVRVQDDRADTGGFLVLVSSNPTFESGKGFDDWVESSERLDDYFREAGWTVEWPDAPL